MKLEDYPEELLYFEYKHKKKLAERLGKDRKMGGVKGCHGRMYNICKEMIKRLELRGLLNGITVKHSLFGNNSDFYVRDANNTYYVYKIIEGGGLKKYEY